MKAACTSALCAVVFALVAGAAHAQTSPSQPAGVRVEPIDSGFVAAPDARFTKVNGELATLAGGYAGWLTDRTLLVGGAAYWLANRHDDFKMQYGGALVRWTIGGHGPVGVSVGALAGVGDATIARPYGELFNPQDPHIADERFRDRRVGRAIDPATPIRLSDDFFVVEPQVTAILNLTPWMRLDVGAGYRAIGGAGLLEDHLRGASGSVALQFGGR